MARFSEKSMRDVFSIWVKVVDNNIGITFMAGCKNNNFKIVA